MTRSISLMLVSLMLALTVALPAAAVLSVLIRFAFHRYLEEHPELDIETDQELE